MDIELPANNWRPRDYQREAWRYLEGGGKRASLWWHRRSGKDELCLNWTSIAATEEIGNYWHMLPEASQARKALWHAVDSHTGRKRIDSVFPEELRARTLDHEMFIEFRNGSTWQVIGSDNFQALVGAPPKGIVFSEWSKAKPQAYAYLAPILMENDGWALFPTTPMGKNHAFRTHQNFETDPEAYAQTLTVDDTGLFSPEALDRERQSYIDIYGHTLGSALFEQEFYCNADVAIMGAVYAGELHEARTSGRSGLEFGMLHAPVYTAWDIGRRDATAIWWFQVVGGEVRFLDYYENTLQDLDHYVAQIKAREIVNDMSEWAYGAHPIRWGAEKPEIEHRQEYAYGMHYLPHDARHKTLSNSGHSIETMLRKALGNVQIIDTQKQVLSSQIALTRGMFRRSWFHRRCADALETLAMYRYNYDENKRILSAEPVHDWTSHCADALRIAGVAVAEIVPRDEARNRIQHQPGRRRARQSRGSAWAN